MNKAKEFDKWAELLSAHIEAAEGGATSIKLSRADARKVVSLLDDAARGEWLLGELGSSVLSLLRELAETDATGANCWCRRTGGKHSAACIEASRAVMIFSND